MNWRIAYLDQADDLARGVADRLDEDEAVAQAIIRTGTNVGVEFLGGGWFLHVANEMDELKATWTGAQWDCYQAIAEALLAMPISTGE